MGDCGENSDDGGDGGGDDGHGCTGDGDEDRDGKGV